MSFDEKLRLLYVACTRARDHLVVSVHRTDRDRPPTSRTLHRRPSCSGTRPDGAVADVDAAGAARARACRAGGRAPAPRSISTRGSRSTTPRSRPARAAASSPRPRSRSSPTTPRPTIPASPKEGRDLELPPWNKGRYGTAIGRAVHAVLQTVDLATGAGLADLAAAQAAAEGVLGLRGDDRRARAVGARQPDGARRVRGGVLARDLRRGAGRRAHARGLRRSRVPRRGAADDGLVVVDYKTDAIDDDATLAARLAHYRVQGAAYAIAVAAATGARVDRCVFVFLSPGRRARGRDRGRRARGRDRRGPRVDPDRSATIRRRSARSCSPTPESRRGPAPDRGVALCHSGEPVKASRFVVNFVLIVALGATALATSVALLVPASRTLVAARHAAARGRREPQGAAAAFVRVRPQRQR